MNAQLNTLLSLRDNINVVTQIALERKDISGETLPIIEAHDFSVIEDAEIITRQWMNEVDPSTI